MRSPMLLHIVNHAHDTPPYDSFQNPCSGEIIPAGECPWSKSTFDIFRCRNTTRRTSTHAWLDFRPAGIRHSPGTGSSGGLPERRKQDPQGSPARAAGGNTAGETTVAEVWSQLGVQLRDLISIVSYQTFVRWIREKEAAHTAKQTSRKPGRPRTPDEIRELVLKLARENSGGYTRILAELSKPGTQSISRQTVTMILKEHDIDPGPKRGKGSWETRLRHRPIREDAGRAAVAKAASMRIHSGNAISCPGRCGRRKGSSMSICSCFSASWQSPRLDFTEHRAARLRMGLPAGQELPDGRRRHGPLVSLRPSSGTTAAMSERADIDLDGNPAAKHRHDSVDSMNHR